MISMAGVKGLSAQPLTTVPTTALIEELFTRSEWMVLVVKEPIKDSITATKGHPVWLQGILADIGIQIHQSAHAQAAPKESA